MLPQQGQGRADTPLQVSGDPLAIVTLAQYGMFPHLKRWSPAIVKIILFPTISPKQPLGAS
jgi:hypothetical protein